MIKTQNLCFSYGKEKILENINISVKKGEIVSLLGPNGSGKTTLLRLVANILKADSGRITINGENIVSIRPARFPKMIAYVPQHISSKFPMTVFDTVLMGRRAYIGWGPSRKDLEAVGNVLSRLKLEEIAMKDMTCLSGGQRQRAVLARAVAQEADFIVLDEPTSSLDMRHQFQTMAIVKELAAEGKGVLVSAHDLRLAAINSHRTAVMKNGRIYSEGSPEETLTEAMLREVYGVNARVSKDGCFSIDIYGVREEL